jgi:hypothetical protein
LDRWRVHDFVIAFAVTLRGEAMKHAIQSVIAACVLASASPAAAQIINGGFEEGGFGDGSVREVSRDDSTTLSGWTVNDNPVAWYTNGYEPPNALRPIGVAPISQTFTVSAFYRTAGRKLQRQRRRRSIRVTIQDGTTRP